MLDDVEFINLGGCKFGFFIFVWCLFCFGGELGLLIFDYFLNVCWYVDKFVLINVCYMDSYVYGLVLVVMNMGKIFIGCLLLGSWVVYGLGSENWSMFGYVVLFDKWGGLISG